MGVSTGAMSREGMGVDHRNTESWMSNSSLGKLKSGSCNTGKLPAMSPGSDGLPEFVGPTPTILSSRQGME